MTGNPLPVGQAVLRASTALALVNLTNDDVTAWLGSAFASRLNAARQTFATNDPTPESVDALTDEVANALDGMAPRRSVQCRAGCAWCCYERVTCSPPEIFHIADEIRATWPPERIARLRTDLDHRAEQIEGLDGADYYRARVRCPLLTEDNCCSVYGVRPLPCRRRTSLKRAMCEDAWQRRDADQPIPHDPLKIMAATDAMTVLYGTTDRFTGKHSYELIAALRVALDQPDACARWLAGEDVLASTGCHEVVLIDADGTGRLAHLLEAAS